MKTNNKAFFLVALLLSASYAYAQECDNQKPQPHHEVTRAQKSPSTPAVSTPSFIDNLTDIVKRSVNAPLSVAGISGYFMYKVGTDLYDNYVKNYGHHITDSSITKAVENIIPFNYGKGMSDWALKCMVGYMAFAAIRKVATSPATPDIVRTPVEVITRAVK